MKTNVKTVAPTTIVAEVQAPKPTKIVTIKVLKRDAKFRGARDAWYKELIAHDGKPLKDFEDACTKKPPSLPKSGRAEAPSGWTSYFVRQGILQKDEVEVKA